MKKLKKIFIVILIVMTLLAILKCNNTFATYNMMDTIKDQAGHTVVENTTEAKAVGSVTTIAGSIITITRVICAAIAIIMLSVLGMKYMMAAPSDKADIKKHAVVYIIGAFVMFACTGILGIIQNFADGIKVS